MALLSSSSSSSKKVETIKKMFISIAEGIDQEPVVNHILNISKFKLMNSLLDQLVVKSAKFNFGYFGFVRLVEFIEFIDRTSIVSFKFFLCRLFFFEEEMELRCGG